MVDKYGVAENQPMTQVDLDHFTYEVVSGMWDPYLDTMAATLRDRLAHRAAMASVSLKPGDRVRLVNIRPNYLEGLEAAVVFNGGGRIKVRFDNPVQRFGRQVDVLPSQVQVLPPEEIPAATKVASETLAEGTEFLSGPTH